MRDFTPASDIIPTAFDATRWENLEPFYSALLERPLESAKAVEKWLLDLSELDAAAAEAAANLYIAMTCHTDDEAAGKAYLDFVENVRPHLRKIGFELSRKFAECPAAKALDPKRYGVLARDLAVEVELFREKNVPLLTRDTTLDQRYGEICGAMTVEFRGERKTMPQMAQLLEETDRELREEAWRATAERRYQDHERVSDIFDEMIALRDEIGRNAGFANYRDYAFRSMGRFDYTPEDCMELHASCEKHCVPLARRLAHERAEALDLDALRPWDQAVDALGREPLRPFEKAETLVEKSSRLFHKMDAELGAMYDAMRGGGCLDLETREGKRPGGYQYQRQCSRQPFIFMNATGMHSDLRTMLHEAGHAFHSTLCRQEPLVHYRHSPIEFAEVASMGMEMLTQPYLEEFYCPAEAGRARRQQLEMIVKLLPWICTIDAFQHWLYTHPQHSRPERTACWLALRERFGAGADWSGLEAHREVEWQRQTHLFGHAFYYIEYGIAQLGALQIWLAARRDQGAALASYKRALELGGSRPLPELFASAGLRFDFSEAMVRELMREVEQELDTLPV